jgi:hypothetical protein
MAMKHGRLLFSTMKEQATKIRSRLLLMLLLAKHATKVNKEILTRDKRKTLNFLNGIHNPKATTAKATAITMLHLLADFTSLANYIASALDIQLTLTTMEQNITDVM